MSVVKIKWKSFFFRVAQINKGNTHFFFKSCDLLCQKQSPGLLQPALQLPKIGKTVVDSQYRRKKNLFSARSDLGGRPRVVTTSLELITSLQRPKGAPAPPK